MHTADAHISTFDTLFEGADPDVARTHRAHPEWLSEAREAGLTEDLRKRVADILIEQASTADAVLCTCSTIGPIADDVSATHKNVFRIDRPLMEKAADHNGKIIVAICVESTLKPTIDLLSEVFAEKAKTLEPVIARCNAAWPHFWSGEREQFCQIIAAEVKRVYADTDNPGCVVLAQASMAVAAPFLSDLPIPVYGSPDAALETILQSLNTE